MTWTRLSDDFPDRPDLLEVSRSARLLHIEALVYGNRHGTDGRIPTAALPRISDSPAIAAEVDELIGAGVWERASAAAVQIREWKERERQELAEVVKAREKYNATKQQKHRDHKSGKHGKCAPRYCEDRRNHDSGDHDGCIGDWCSGNETSNAPSNAPGVVTDSQPSPSTPRPKEGGSGGGAREPDCHECGKPADWCRARERSSGHAYVPRPPDAPLAAVRRAPLISAPDVTPQAEAVVS